MEYLEVDGGCRCNEKLLVIFHLLSCRHRGFSLIEIIVVIAIAALIFSLVFTAGVALIENSRFARAKLELTEVAQGTQMYLLENGNWPEDVDRDIPPGVEAFLAPRSWPNAPWPGSVYDWDAKEVNGEKFYQISIRFCPYGHPESCAFPKEPWAEDFDYYSSVYLCMEGPCRAHPNMPIDHPGYCINCQDEE